MLNLATVVEASNEITRKHKNHSIYYIYPNVKLLVYEKDLAERILNTNFDKVYEYQFHDVWLKGGLLTSNYKNWKGQKKSLLPAFNINNLAQYIHEFNEKAKVLCNKLEEIGEETPVDIHYYVNLCAFDVILAAAIGANLNVQHNPQSKYLKAIKQMLTTFYFRAITSVIIPIFLKLKPFYFIEKRAGKILNDFAWKFIRERRSGISTSSTKTLLDMLLENEDITNDEIKAQLNTFTFAGHDTSAITLSLALFLLSKHPEIQNKVYQEIIKVIGHGNNPSYKDLMDLTYTSMVLMEVSRLYPAVPLIGRTITKDLEWNGCILPEGLHTYISIVHIHRNSEYFPEPEKFDPERFNGENIKKIPQFAYLPFSYGARSCIGQKFAQLEMKALLVNILQQYEIFPISDEYDVKITPAGTMDVIDGVKIKLRKR